MATNNIEAEIDPAQQSDVMYMARLMDGREPLGDWMQFPHAQSIIEAVKSFLESDGGEEEEEYDPTPPPYEPTGVDSPVGAPVLV